MIALGGGVEVAIARSGIGRAIVIICTKRKMSGGKTIEHIVELEWRDTSDGKSGRSSRETLVKYVDDGNTLYCENQSGGQPSEVHVERPYGRPPYLRTQPNNTPLDNLLSLPEYY